MSKTSTQLRQEASTTARELRARGMSAARVSEAVAVLDREAEAAEARERADSDARLLAGAMRLEERGVPAYAGRTLAERADTSESVRAFRLREAGGVGGRMHGDLKLGHILSTRELANGLRARTVFDETAGAGLLHEIPAERLTTIAPQPTRVLDVVRVVPLESPLLEHTETGSFSGAAGGTPEGVAVPELTNLSLTQETVALKPWSVAGEVARQHLTDSALFSSAMDTLFRRELKRSAEAAILNGDGVSDGLHWDPTGILQTSGVPVVAKGTGTRVAAISAAVADVMAAGWFDEPGGITVTAHPTTLAAIFSESTSGGVLIPIREAVPFVSQWVPSLSVPVGSAVVGAFNMAALLVTGGLDFTIALSHLDYFIKGIAVLKLDTRAAFRVLETSAFANVTGL